MTPRLLLTSGGLTNPTIIAALEGLLGKPLSESQAVVVPTAAYALEGGPEFLAADLSEQAGRWKQWALLELSTLETIPLSCWMPSLQSADVVVVGGGNTPYLSYWAFRSGFADTLRGMLDRIVYVGVSAGSLIASHSFDINHDRLAQTGIYADEQYNDIGPAGAGSDRTLQFTDFAIRPHLNAPYFRGVALADMEQVAARSTVPVYAIDDASAIVVAGGRTEVVSEGQWHLLASGAQDQHG